MHFSCEVCLSQIDYNFDYKTVTRYTQISAYVLVYADGSLKVRIYTHTQWEWSSPGFFSNSSFEKVMNFDHWDFNHHFESHLLWTGFKFSWLFFCCFFWKTCRGSSLCVRSHTFGDINPFFLNLNSVRGVSDFWGSFKFNGNPRTVDREKIDIVV